MNLKNAASDPRVMRLSISLSRYTPESVAQRVAWWLSGAVCRLKPAVHRVVQSNLAQVLAATAQEPDLDLKTRQVFYTAMRGYYDFFRMVRLPSQEAIAAVDVPAKAREAARSLPGRQGGVVLVFPHLGSFDLLTQVASAYLPDIQVLTLPDPPPGFEIANKLRRQSGLVVTPLSSASLRAAIRRLRSGGVVALAGDRPVSELDEPQAFFGRPARIPSGHVRLALQAGSVVAVIGCVFDAVAGRHTLVMQPPLEMVRTGDRDEEMRINMRRVVEELEAMIGRWLEQWQMFVPVWPELVEP
jgi:KDO2-lipid IV(A) lauroyltransferase